MKKKKIVVIFIAFFIMVFSVMVFAAPGDLDPTFGTGGATTYRTYYSPNKYYDQASGVAIQKDGKIVVVGESFNGANLNVLVLRYTKQGMLDDTFGTGGVVTYNSSKAHGVAIQKDGKIVVVGVSFNGANEDSLVLRYNTNGTLDDTFGTGGVVTYNYTNDYASAVAIQNDGKIVVAGYSDNDALVLRYNTNGTLDDTFGTGGVVTYNGGDTVLNAQQVAYAVAIQRDGKIVVVGFSDYDALVLRYNTNGTLDNTFGTGGVVTYNGPANKYDGAYGVAIQSDGKIVVVGYSNNGATNDVLILGYTKKGILDTTFGSGGVITYNRPSNNDDRGLGIAIQTVSPRDVKIVVVGLSFSGATNWDALILRYTKQGILDTTFGTGGVVNYTNPSYGPDYGYGVAIQKDGKIVVVGYSDNPTDCWSCLELLVFRLLGK